MPNTIVRYPRVRYRTIGIVTVPYDYVRHGGRHMFIPFAMEDGGRIGAHGHAALRMLAKYAIAKGKLPPIRAA